MENQLSHEHQVFKLRNYQDECLYAIAECLTKGQQRLLVSLPCSSGKTVIFASLIQKMSHPRTLIFVHTEELIQQTADKLSMVCIGISVGLVNANNKNFEATVVIASIQAAYVKANLKKLIAQNFDLLIYDECHHSSADNARKIINDLGFGKNTKRCIVGFTATPYRTDGKGLGEVFDVVAYEKDIQYMIQQGWLVPPIAYKIKTDLDLSAIKTIDGELQQVSLSELMNTPEMNVLVVKSYLDKAQDRRTICFAVDVKHAIALAETFQQYGIASKAIYGSMPAAERNEIIELYRAGNITVLTNCAILTEGFDDPETTCVILARPTKSLSLFVQCLGRGLRKAPWAGKLDCILLDFGSKNHNIISLATLYRDHNIKAIKCDVVQESPEEVHKQIARDGSDIPLTLDQELKSVLVSFDLLGNSFFWEKHGKSHVLRSGENSIEISPYGGKWLVVYTNLEKSKTIAKNVLFEYAFGIAEEFAKEHKNNFMLSDLRASWRSKPITEKQQAVFKKRGYNEAGISQLSAGQASVLIRSGVLNRK